MASPDVGRMGIEILSFTIKDVYDTVTYLASLGMYSVFILVYCARLMSYSIYSHEFKITRICIIFPGKAQTAAVKRDAEIGVAQVCKSL